MIDTKYLLRHLHINSGALSQVSVKKWAWILPEFGELMGVRGPGEGLSRLECPICHHHVTESTCNDYDLRNGRRVLKLERSKRSFDKV